MQKHYTAESLKEEIKALEIRQKEEELHLRRQLINVYENLKPINIIKNIFRDAASTDGLKHDIINTLTSLLSGFVSKKLLIGKSSNPFLKLLGMSIQLGMTTLMSRKYNSIKDAIGNFVSRIQERRSTEN